jgi:hypothetical protein
VAQEKKEKKRILREIPCVNLELVCDGQLSFKVENSVVRVGLDECSNKKWGLLMERKKSNSEKGIGKIRTVARSIGLFASVVAAMVGC